LLGGRSPPVKARLLGSILAILAVDMLFWPECLCFFFTLVHGDGYVEGLELLEEGLQQSQIIIDFRKELNQLVVRQISPFGRLSDKGADHVSFIIRGHRLRVPFWS
jgi:hypothetical protein